jgi:hypothetical protein
MALARLSDAKAVLLEGEQHLGESSAILHFNLACYECQLGDIEAAKVRLRRACKLGGKEIQALALDEEDLKPMWDQIAAM